MTQQVRLRPPTRADLPFIRALWADAATMEAVGGIVPLSVDAAEAWFRRMVDPGAPTDRYFLIETTDGRPIGEISFHRRDLERDTAGLNVKVLASERGRGHGHAAMTTFLTWYFEELGAREITDDLAPGNLPGRRLMERFGFVHDPSIEGVRFMRLDRVTWLERRRN